MRMATSSSMGFHQTSVPSSPYSRHMVSFQPGLVSSSTSTSMIPTNMNSFGGVNSAAAMIFTGDPIGLNSTSALIPVGSATAGLHLDPAPGLKYDTGLVADWSPEEHAWLEEGLVMFAHEPTIMKYIKIAAMLQNKTVRDVALRCCWMMKKENGKRRKHEEHCTGKRVKDKKEKLVDCSSSVNLSSSQSSDVPSCSFTIHHMDKSNGIFCEGPIIDGATQYLLEENVQVLGQIKHNLDSLKLQDNVDLFFRAKNNIDAILRRMSEMPGIMSQMPALPVSINEELAGAILSTRQASVFGAADIVNFKHESWC